MARPPVKTVFLDAGKTLLTEREARPAIYAQLAHAHGGRDDAEAAQEAMSQAFEELPQVIEGHYRFSLEWFRTFNARIWAALDVPEDRWADAHDAAVARFEDPATYRLFDEVPAFLEELRERGLQTGIISNWSERLPALCADLGIAELVDFVVASADIRAEKPERACFERALFRAGVRPEEAVHVGDRVSRDVRGALDAGLRAVLLHRDPDTPPPALDGITVVRSLDELLPLLPASVQSASTA